MKRIPLLFLFLSLALPGVVAGQEDSGWFGVKEVARNVWRIDDHHAANVYLIVGRDSALVVDTGMGAADLASQVKKLTDKPLIVVNTHGHPDHTGANYQFEKVYIHPADTAMARTFDSEEARKNAAQSMLQGQQPGKEETYAGTHYHTRYLPVREGHTFSLGGRTLEVIETPGHTPGEIVLLDRDNKLLFTGDNDNLLVWLFLKGCTPLHQYLVSLEKLSARISEFTTLFPGHGDLIPADFILDQIACVKGILNSTLESKPYQSFAGNAMVATYGRASVAYNPENL